MQGNGVSLFTTWPSLLLAASLTRRSYGMAWLGLLALMLLVAAAPGISMYVEHLRAAPAPEAGDGETPRHA